MLGAKILLGYFHYCNKGMYPFSDECKDKDLRKLADLSQDELQLVHATRLHVKQRRELPPTRTGSSGQRLTVCLVLRRPRVGATSGQRCIRGRFLFRQPAVCGQLDATIDHLGGCTRGR